MSLVGLERTGSRPEARSLVSLPTQYRQYTTPDRAVFERGLHVAVKLLAPLAPHVTEELHRDLGGDDEAVAADWPTPERDVADVVVRSGDGAGEDLARKARPGRPAIEIHE